MSIYFNIMYTNHRLHISDIQIYEKDHSKYQPLKGGLFQRVVYLSFFLTQLLSKQQIFTT